MTEQDKNEIRQILREELAALKVPTMVFAAAACNHEWYFEINATVPTTRCRKCGQLPSEANAVAVTDGSYSVGAAPVPATTSVKTTYPLKQ